MYAPLRGFTRQHFIWDSRKYTDISKKVNQIWEQNSRWGDILSTVLFNGISMTMYEGIVNLSSGRVIKIKSCTKIQTQRYILHLLWWGVTEKRCSTNTATLKKGWPEWLRIGTRVTQVLKSSQTYLPREKNAAIFLNVEDASIHRSTVLCRHCMFNNKMFFFLSVLHTTRYVSQFWFKKKNPKQWKKYVHVLLNNYNVCTHIWKNLWY